MGATQLECTEEDGVDMRCTSPTDTLIRTSISSKQDITFESGKEILAAWMYMPPVSTQAVPCVVMANGISLTRNDGLFEYADAFAKMGLAVLIFDYAYFGDSTGMPRQRYNISQQKEDLEAAVAFARSQPGIHPGGIILWGYSFGCGTVIKVAHTDSNIAACICVAPFLKRSGTVISKSTIGHLATSIMKDSLHAVKPKQPPVMCPVVGPPGSFAIITTEEGVPGFNSVVPPDSRWVNEIAVRGLVKFPLDHPSTYARDLAMPVMFCVGSYDQTALPRPTLQVAKRLPRGTVKLYAAGHFSIHQNANVIPDQIAFIEKHMKNYLTRIC